MSSSGLVLSWLQVSSVHRCQQYASSSPSSYQLGFKSSSPAGRAVALWPAVKIVVKHQVCSKKATAIPHLPTPEILGVKHGASRRTYPPQAERDRKWGPGKTLNEGKSLLNSEKVVRQQGGHILPGSRPWRRLRPERQRGAKVMTTSSSCCRAPAIRISQEHMQGVEGRT